MSRPLAYLLAALLVSTPSMALAEETQPLAPISTDAYDKDRAHGYAGFGLVIASSTFSAPLVPDVDASGGGLFARGVGHSAKVNPSLDIAFTGQVALMSRTEDDTDNELGDFLLEVDGGMRLSDSFYVSLGYVTQSSASDATDITTTYNVIPLSAGILRTSESGYFLLQLRLGGGELSNDDNDATERVEYGGIRAVVQHGFGSGLQFMAGLGLDRFNIEDLRSHDDFVRLDFGLGFGL